MIGGKEEGVEIDNVMCVIRKRQEFLICLKVVESFLIGVVDEVGWGGYFRQRERYRIMEEYGLIGEREVKVEVYEEGGGKEIELLCQDIFECL